MRFPVNPVPPRKGRLVVSMFAMLAIGLAVSGCDKRQEKIKADLMSTQSTSGAQNVPSFKKTEELARRWQENPADASVGMAYADNLEKLGQRPVQIGVLKTVADRNPRNPQIQTRVGKELLQLGEGGEAIEVLERAAQMNPADWQTLSALGTAYDQQTRHAEARQKYQMALQLKPGELSVQNNLGMSYALEGKLPEAEKLLRQAMANPASEAMPRIRQNLALVVGLQGRFEESQKIASADLPPEQVQANLAYLQQMLSRPNTWQQLSSNQSDGN